jgi:Bromodomain
LFDAGHTSYVVPIDLYKARLDSYVDAVEGSNDVIRVRGFYEKEGGEEDSEFESFEGIVVDFNVRDANISAPHLSGSGYCSVRVEWTSDQTQDELCPWEFALTSASSSVHRPRLTDVEKQKVRKAFGQVKAVESYVSVFGSAVDTGRYYDYLSRIEVPMDLGLMTTRLECDYYSSLLSVVADMQLIRDNCSKYNGDDDMLTELARNMLSLFQSAILTEQQGAAVDEAEAAVIHSISTRGIPETQTSHRSDRRSSVLERLLTGGATTRATAANVYRQPGLSRDRTGLPANPPLVQNLGRTSVQPSQSASSRQLRRSQEWTSQVDRAHAVAADRPVQRPSRTSRTDSMIMDLAVVQPAAEINREHRSSRRLQQSHPETDEEKESSSSDEESDVPYARNGPTNARKRTSRKRGHRPPESSSDSSSNIDDESDSESVEVFAVSKRGGQGNKVRLTRRSLRSVASEERQDQSILALSQTPQRETRLLKRDRAAAATDSPSPSRRSKRAATATRKTYEDPSSSDFDGVEDQAATSDTRSASRRKAAVPGKLSGFRVSSRYIVLTVLVVSRRLGQESFKTEFCITA